MFTAFRCFTDGCAASDGTPLHDHLTRKYGMLFVIPYVLSFMLVTVGIFNLIMATFIENVMVGSTRRNLEALGHSYFEVKNKMATVFHQMMLKNPEDYTPEQVRQLVGLQGPHGEVRAESLPKDLSISRERFQEWLKDLDVCDLLKEAEIETSNKTELFDVLDVDMSGYLEVDELINGLMRVRGPITKADIIAVRLKVRYMTNVLDVLRYGQDSETVKQHRKSEG
eukprot:TRINITY_DN12453_c1_g1_i1.p1 TRINITY_DN12453_c1_g1~~TRINITY_DN12453_c1_g1_i1.p1  ORF type:complete len:225 (-),score=33.33 TRINITY_DN12453_c1_g1_i1:31-705(-)